MNWENQTFEIQKKMRVKQGDKNQLSLFGFCSGEALEGNYTDFEISPENMDELAKMRKAEENPFEGKK